MARLKLKELESILGQFKTFEKPKIKLEQYSTSAHIAARILHTIDSMEDLEGKSILDLGCGTGIFSLGSSVLGASYVLGVDIDCEALDISLENMQEIELSNTIDFIQFDINDLDQLDRLNRSFDIVVMNPPFGTKHNKGIDMVFLKNALKMAVGSVYSLHKTSTRQVDWTSAPVYDHCFKNLVVTFSGGSKERRQFLIKKLEEMGGFHSLNLTKKCTHVVSDSVVAIKSRVARSLKIPILTEDWIEESWQKAKSKRFHAGNKHYINNYRIPIFQGVSASASQLDLSARLEISELIKKNGGKYSGTMDINKTSHLVLELPEGTKYEAAIRNNISVPVNSKGKIYVVNKNWVSDSIETQTALLEDEYLVGGKETPSDFQNRQSTNKNHNSVLASTIIERTQLPGTSRCENNNHSMADKIKSPVNVGLVKETCKETTTIDVDSQSFLDLKDSINIPNIPGLFDGLTFLFVGVNQKNQNYIKRAIIGCDGLTASRLGEDVTHAVIGFSASSSQVDNLKKQIEQLDYSVSFVNFEWITTSIKNKKIEQNSFIQNTSIKETKKRNSSSEDSPEEIGCGGAFRITKKNKIIQPINKPISQNVSESSSFKQSKKIGDINNDNGNKPNMDDTLNFYARIAEIKSDGANKIFRKPVETNYLLRPEPSNFDTNNGIELSTQPIPSYEVDEITANSAITWGGNVRYSRPPRNTANENIKPVAQSKLLRTKKHSHHGKNHN